MERGNQTGAVQGQEHLWLRSKGAEGKKVKRLPPPDDGERSLPAQFTGNFQRAFTFTFVVATLTFAVLGVVWVRVMRRLRFQREREKNIIDAEVVETDPQ